MRKKLYASLGIAEYRVVDVKGSQVFFFRLDDQGQHHEIQISSVLEGLETSLLEETLLNLDPMTNMDAALWFKKQIAKENNSL